MFIDLNKYIIFHVTYINTNFILFNGCIVLLYQCTITNLTSFWSMVIIFQYFCYKKQNYNEDPWTYIMA